MDTDQIKKEIEQQDKDIELSQKNLKKVKELADYEGPDRVMLMEERAKEIEEERGRVKTFVAKTSLSTFDATTEGFRPGNLIVLSGPTKNGKSSFCRFLTQKFSQDHKVLWFPYEETHEEMVRHYSGIADFYVPRIMTSGNMDWVEDRIVEAKVKYGTQIVFIDHLDFLRDEKYMRNVGMNMSGYIGGIVQRVKRIAVEQELCIFLMCHIKKNNWHANELPTSEDIRDSGQIPQLADMVLMMKRDIAENSEEIYATTSVLGVIENRFNGKTRKIKLNFEDGEYSEATPEGLTPPPDNVKAKDLGL